MKLAIMQPYLFPYIGYWQLLNGVDCFVVFDDVNYINRGWINRNRILVDGEPRYFNVQMRGASQNQRINEVALTNDLEAAEKQLRTIAQAYGRAPEFSRCFPLVQECMRYEGRNLADFVTHSIRRVMDYLDIGTKLVLSSELDKDDALRGQDKILDICTRLGAAEYWNPIGGTALYEQERFLERGIRLRFLRADDTIRYRQFGGEEFVPNLSILDVLMFNSKEETRGLLTRFSLL